MNWLENSQFILAALVAVLWLAGFVVVLVKPRGRQAGWIPVVLLSLFLIGLGVDLFFVNRDLGGVQKVWSRGWILPHDQDGAITIGVLEDALGLTMAMFSTLLAIALAGNRWAARRERSPERIHGGLLMGVAGISVAWLSLTPWLSLLGMAMTVLGGLVMLGAQQDAERIEIFGIEMSTGLVLSFAGAAVLAGGRAALALSKGFVLAPSNLSHGFDVLGGLLLALGLFVLMQPVPFLSWLIRAPEVSSASSLIVAQLFPALATLGLAIRFEPELRALGIFPALQWLAFASAALTALCGLSQKNWKTALPLWLAASLSFGFSAYCYSGATTALPFFIGVMIAGAAISILVSAREEGLFGAKARSWFHPLLGISAAGAVGMLGFVSSGALARMFTQAAPDPALLSAWAVALLLIDLLFWKVLFSIRNSGSEAKEPVGTHAVSPLVWTGILLVLSLGLIWTGNVTGGVIPHDPDRLFDSLFSILFAAPGGVADWGDEAGLALGQGLLWAVLVVSAGVGYWLFARGEGALDEFLQGSARLRDFLSSGYFVDRLGAAVARAIRATGDFAEKWVNEKLSIRWVPLVIEKMLHFPARWLDRMDREIYAREEAVLRQWVEVPAKVLQVVQNGDVQWYLVFGVGSIVALLIHFAVTK